MNTSTLNRRHKQGLAWLARNPSVWAGHRRTQRVLTNIFRMMQVAGLYSYRSTPSDSIQVIRRNLNRIRKP